MDPLFPPPFEWPNQKKMQFGENSLEENKFSIIFDEVLEEESLMKLYENAEKDENMGEIDEEDEYYEDEGKEWVEENWMFIFLLLSLLWFFVWIHFWPGRCTK